MGSCCVDTRMETNAQHQKHTFVRINLGFLKDRLRKTPGPLKRPPNQNTPTTTHSQKAQTKLCLMGPLVVLVGGLNGREQITTCTSKDKGCFESHQSTNQSLPEQKDKKGENKNAQEQKGSPRAHVFPQHLKALGSQPR